MQTPEYIAWANMLKRCRNPNFHSYHRYGGRGITVCQEWYEFKNFFADMGERPEGLTLERINNDLGYFSENCRWASKLEQAHNQGLRKDSTTGIKGVSKCGGRYRAYGNLEGKRCNLYSGYDLDAAIEARRDWELVNLPA